MTTLTGEVPDTSFSPDYHRMERETETRLLQEIVDANPEVFADARLGLIALKGDSPYSNLARSLECRVFDEYFKNDPSEMRKEYEPYEDSSIFFLIVDKEDLEAAGVMRVIHPGEVGLKSVNDIITAFDDEKQKKVTDLTVEEVYGVFGIEADNTLDVATIAAHPDYMGSGKTTLPILAPLMRAIYLYAQETNHDELVAIITEKPLGQLKIPQLPIHTTPYIASNFDYMGAKDNSFIHIPIPQVETAVTTHNQGVYDYIFGDVALSGACVLNIDPQ